MISLPPKLLSWGDVARDAAEFRLEREQTIEQLVKNSSPEMQICWAAGVEMQLRVENGKVYLETVPQVGIADLGDGTTKVYVRYPEESAREVFAPGRSARYRPSRVQR